MNTVTNNTATTAAEILASVPWDIHNIEAITEETAALIADDFVRINCHTVYFIDFPGYFGYSALVFANGRHIHYANNYKIHHPNKSTAELHTIYINTLRHTLFTDVQLVAPLDTYDDYKAREYYLHNYYGMRYDHVSAFYIGDKNKPNTDGMIYSPRTWSYFKAEDADVVTRINDLYDKLDEMFKAAMLEYDFAKSAFLYEMYNHEYAINWQGDFDVLNTFGGVRYVESDNRSHYFKQLGFTATQIAAYEAAAAECRENSDY